MKLDKISKTKSNIHGIMVTTVIWLAKTMRKILEQHK